MTINWRLKRGREISVAEGKFVGNIAPFKYDRVRLKDSNPTNFELHIYPKLIKYENNNIKNLKKVYRK